MKRVKLLASTILGNALLAFAICAFVVPNNFMLSGSTGGMDIPPCILQKYKGIPVGTSLMWFDTAVVLLQVCFNGPDGILHSVLIIFIMSMAVNYTVVTGEKTVEVIIISPAYEQIRKAVLERMDCGATMLDIETGYQATRQ